MMEVREAAKSQAVDLDPALFHETLNFSKSLGDFKPSMLQDLETGRPMEIEAIVRAKLQKAGNWCSPRWPIFLRGWRKCSS